jgi:hypothetical protein
MGALFDQNARRGDAVLTRAEKPNLGDRHCNFFDIRAGEHDEAV